LLPKKQLERLNMLSMNIGPFALSSNVLLLLAAGLAAAGVGHLVGRREQTGIVNTLSDMLIAGVLVARIAFVILWFDTYRSSPWSMLDIRDGGFTPWAGVTAALLVALWRGWRQPTLRKPLILGLATGALVWGALFGALRMTEQPTLPKLALTTLAGTPTSLAALTDGKPMVVNLWASWCPAVPTRNAGTCRCAKTRNRGTLRVRQSGRRCGHRPALPQRRTARYYQCAA
jgi:hypothetical protein